MKIEYSPAFQRHRKRCEKRGWKISDLVNILKSYVSKCGFSKAETVKYKDHTAKGKWKDHREFHPYGRHHDWVVIYHLEDNTIVLDDTAEESKLILDDTGSHKEIFGSHLE